VSALRQERAKPRGNVRQRVGGRDGDNFEALAAAVGNQRRLYLGGRTLPLARILRGGSGFQKSRSA
jgi:hypothetical protein